ncbi:MAG: hypothetical protein H6739_36445 [Alphaproteobacteria bacterium]|nr:hypothetical protein [Alphaproteobacteria bacterium]
MTRCALALCVGLLGAGEAHAACTNADLSAQLDRAEQAFAGWDFDTFTAARAEVDQALACLTEPIPPALVARIHRVHVYEQKLALDASHEQLARTCQALFAVDPDVDLSALPEGDPAREVCEEARTRPAGPTAPVPTGCLVHIDGAPDTRRPTDRPCVVQVFDTDDVPVLTEWMPPDALLVDPCPKPRPPRWPLALTSVSMLAVGGVWTATGLAARQVHQDNVTVVDRGQLLGPDIPSSRATNLADLERYRTWRTAATATTGVALGITTTALVIRVRF